MPYCCWIRSNADYVPEYIKKAAFAEYGETLEGAAEGKFGSITKESLMQLMI